MSTTKLVKFINKKNYVIGFLIFMILFFYLHRFIYMGADDFYYANFWNEGLKGFIKQNINHYTHLTGRAFVHLLCETVLSLGMPVFGVINCIFIALTIIYSAKIADYSNENNSTIAKSELLLCLFLFSSLNVMILRESVLWVSGSYNYLFPIMLQSIYFYFLHIIISKR